VANAEPFWQDVAFSESFVDISTSTLPKFQTRVKVRFDDEFLYVGAHLHDEQVWANISHTCHCLDPKQDQVCDSLCGFVMWGINIVVLNVPTEVSCIASTVAIAGDISRQ
jgi:hypothetical protein